MKKLLVITGFILLVLFGPTSALAFGAYTGGTTGYDVSSPQCTNQYPSLPYSFGIVGVTSGRAFTQNPCISSEFAWAKNGSTPPSLYINLSYIIGTTSSYGMSGPAGNCSKKDKVCQSYNYGYNAAQYSYNYTTSQSATSNTWWLDIETSNSWSPNTSLNDRVIQGAMDFLHNQGATVGIYSTKNQWNTIAGSFTPNLPNWVSGASSIATAPNYCSSSYSFGGGQVWLVQYPNSGFDGDYACP